MPGGTLIAPVFGLIIAFLAFSVVLNTILGRHKDLAPQALAPELAAYDREASVAANWSREDLLRIAQALAESLDLEVPELNGLMIQEGEFVAKDLRPIIGGNYIFRIAPVESRQLVTGMEIEAFHAAFKVEDIKKGILLTNGFFSEDAVYQAEDRPVGILNRLAISEWAESSGFALPSPENSPTAQGTKDEQPKV
jgi:hypothetical protein